MNDKGLMEELRQLRRTRVDEDRLADLKRWRKARIREAQERLETLESTTGIDVTDDQLSKALREAGRAMGLLSVAGEDETWHDVHEAYELLLSAQDRRRERGAR